MQAKIIPIIYEMKIDLPYGIMSLNFDWSPNDYGLDFW